MRGRGGAAGKIVERFINLAQRLGEHVAAQADVGSVPQSILNVAEDEVAWL